MRYFWGAIFLILVGCKTEERFVKLTDESINKASMIYVNTVVEQYVVTFSSVSIRIEQSTVPVLVRGAGVVVSPSGHILTCDHLLSIGERGDTTVCLYNGQCQKADILYRDSRLDLALLKIDNEGRALSYAKIADPRTLKVGQEVLAIGNPLGLEFSVSHGIISALNRDEAGVYNMTQSDTSTNPGNSGGPLFNLKGELVGINSRILSPVDGPIFTGLGFSVQCGQIGEFLTRFKGLEKVWR